MNHFTKLRVHTMAFNMLKRVLKTKVNPWLSWVRVITDQWNYHQWNYRQWNYRHNNPRQQTNESKGLCDPQSVRRLPMIG